jgi:two-component system KDP operon response regulator KdpE
MVQQQANAGNPVTVLVVEDDLSLLGTVEENLRAQGYRVETAVTGAEALEQAARARPDVVILDLGLPDMDGLEVIAGLQGWSAAPVIVLSARAAQQQKIDALDAGAGDYVTKPFGMGELLARLRATLRVRAGAADTADSVPIVRTADFTIDLAARRVSRDGKDVALTRTQWQIVELFARHPGRLITRRRLLAEVWGIEEDDGGNNYVRVFMTRIRRKLEPDPAHPRYFVTEPGSGLRFLPDGGGAAHGRGGEAAAAD